MSVWEITTSLIDRVAMLVVADDDESSFERSKELAKRFDLSGARLHWVERPKLGVFVDKRSKKPKPRADISPFKPGALMLSEKAYQALGDFLANFGQLLEVDVEGHTEYYFNVTTIIHCLDRERSKIQPFGFVETAVLNEDAIPTAPTVFKDPAIQTSIYINDAAKADLEGRIAQRGLTGKGFRRVDV
ncbi:hypothetical protein [Dyella sp.]|uniref:hypothetical protein n=1 Tax=Dyella sp. TaxID=1869338 RepID=UPI002B480560|nr:hypothetical protein [Dyella sp.]HKT27490.1 hypothetical protein [Dyella sp.]